MNPSPTRTLTFVPESPSLAELQARCARAIGQLVLDATGDLSRSTALITLLDAYIPGLLEVWVLLPHQEWLPLREIPGAPLPEYSEPLETTNSDVLRFRFRVPGHEAWLILGRKASFQRSELRAAVEVASSIAVVLELKSALLQRTRILRDDFDLLVAATQEISRCQGLEELYDAIAREGQRLLKQRKHNLICLQRYSAAFEEVIFVALTGDDTDHLKGLRLSTDVARTKVRHYPRYENDHIADALPRQNALSFTGSLIKSGLDYLLIPDVAQLSPDDPYYGLSDRTRSEIAVPIVLQDGTRWGVLNVENPHPNAFSEFFDLPLLQGFARIISVFIQEIERRDKTYTLDDISLPSDLKKAIKLFAQSDESVLVSGETGTGKEVVARALHYGGARRKFKFIPVNCGAIEPNLMMSELFGYVGHAFSGSSSKDKAGLFQAADQGTIFLDEVENMPTAVQEAVLRVVERGELRKVGSTAVETVDVRIVAATNVDLRHKIQDGTFRQDLYYRLKILEINLPPLRDRPEFIPELFWQFVHQYRRPLQQFEPTPELLAALQHYRWPGNVRELKNLVKRLLVFSSTPTVELLPDEIKHEIKQEALQRSQGTNAASGRGQLAPGPVGTPSTDLAPPGTPTGLQLHVAFEDDAEDVLRTLERQVIQAALNRFNGDKYRVARFLGISPPSVYRKIKEYGITEERRFE